MLHALINFKVTLNKCKAITFVRELNTLMSTGEPINNVQTIPWQDIILVVLRDYVTKAMQVKHVAVQIC